jgi:FtsH-binding integral membrane protein
MAWYDEQQRDDLNPYSVTPGSAIAYEATQSNVMNSVFQHMALGLGATGLTAMFTASSPSLLEFALSNMFPLIIAELALVFAMSFFINKLSAVAATGMFYAYAVLTGLALSPIFLVYTHGSIASTFFVTGGTFGAMAAYGYFTKRDLTSMGGFLIMGLIGLILASVVNLFLKSSALMWMTTYIGILIFVGLTAYDTQKIKNMAYSVESEEDRRKLGIIGALTLYLDFINLFLKLLRVLGRRR